MGLRRFIWAEYVTISLNDGAPCGWAARLGQARKLPGCGRQPDSYELKAHFPQHYVLPLLPDKNCLLQETLHIEFICGVVGWHIKGRTMPLFSLFRGCATKLLDVLSAPFRFQDPSKRGMESGVPFTEGTYTLGHAQGTTFVRLKKTQIKVDSKLAHLSQIPPASTMYRTQVPANRFYIHL